MKRPHFPDFRPKPAVRTLALLDPLRARLITEAGEVIPVDTYTDFRRESFARGLLSYGPKDTTAYVAGGIADPAADVMVHKKTHRGGSWDGTSYRMGAVRMREGSRARWLVPLSTWDLPNEPESLATLREAFDLAGVGDCTTPSALGLALMRKHYDRREPLLWRPPWADWKLLHRELFGGRSDLIHPHLMYPVAWELDMRSAYPAAAMAIPCDWPTTIEGEPPDWAVASYSVCLVHAHGGALGPLPVRGSERTDYPTTGTWVGVYWDMEVERARALGWDVTRGRGLAWADRSRGLAPWTRAVYDLRHAASTPVAYILKGASVAAPGRFGEPATVQTLTTTPGPSDEPLVRPGAAFSGLFVHQELRDRATLLPHVASYIHATVRAWLYDRALPEAESGHLIATNFDALYTSAPPAELGHAAFLGEWRATELQNFRADARRRVETDTPGKTKRPGIKRAG